LIDESRRKVRYMMRACRAHRSPVAVAAIAGSSILIAPNACAPADPLPGGAATAYGVAAFRGGPTHHGSYEDVGIEREPELRWAFSTGGPVTSSPAIADGLAYVGSDDGSMYAVDTRTGTEAWRFETGGPVRSSPAVAGGVVFFGSYDGSFYALDAASGRLVWRFRTTGERRWRARNLDGMTPRDEIHEDPWDFFQSSPAIVDGALFFGTGEGVVYSLDARTGEVRWTVETDDTVHSSPAVADGIVYVGNMESRLYALAAGTGEELWHYQAGTDSVTFNQHGLQSSPVVAGGRIYVGGRDGGLHTVDAATGLRLWKLDTSGSWVLGSAAIVDTSLYLGTSDTNVLRAVDAATGDERWSTSLGTCIYSSPAIAGGMLYVGTCGGVLFGVDAVTGDIRWRFRTEASRRDPSEILNDDGTWNFANLFAGEYTVENAFAAVDRFLDLGAFLSSPVPRDGVLYIGSADGNLYALGPG